MDDIKLVERITKITTYQKSIKPQLHINVVAIQVRRFQADLKICYTITKLHNNETVEPSSYFDKVN